MRSVFHLKSNTQFISHSFSNESSNWGCPVHKHVKERAQGILGLRFKTIKSDQLQDETAPRNKSDLSKLADTSPLPRHESVRQRHPTFSRDPIRPHQEHTNTNKESETIQIKGESKEQEGLKRGQMQKWWALHSGDSPDKRINRFRAHFGEEKTFLQGGEWMESESIPVLFLPWADLLSRFLRLHRAIRRPRGELPLVLRRVLSRGIIRISASLPRQMH